MGLTQLFCRNYRIANPSNEGEAGTEPKTQETLNIYKKNTKTLYFKCLTTLPFISNLCKLMLSNFPCR